MQTNSVFGRVACIDTVQLIIRSKKDNSEFKIILVPEAMKFRAKVLHQKQLFKDELYRNL